MELVFVETQEEWNFLRGFLSENIQSRGQFKDISTNKNEKMKFWFIRKIRAWFLDGGYRKERRLLDVADLST